MRKLLIALIISYCSFLFSSSELFYIPKWEYIDVDGTRIIYDKTYQKRARLVASFLQYIIENQPEMRPLLKSEQIVIDANFISDNLNFDFYNFVENSFRKQHRTKLDYDPITLNNLQQLTDIPISLNFNDFKKDILQYTYNLTSGRTLQGTKKILYPDWFQDPTETNQKSDLLVAFERRIQLDSYDNYRDFALNNKNFSVNQLLNSSYLRKQPKKLYLGILAQDYFMLEFGLKKWEKIVKDVEYFDNIFFPYSSAFKKHTGLTLNQFYKNTHKFYRRKFNSDISSLPPDVSKAFFKEDIITKNKSFSHPHFLHNDDLVTIYSSYEEAPTIVRINQAKEISKITDFGFSSSEKISVNEPYVLWSQNFAYPNFYNFSNSRIAVYNLKNSQTSYIGSNSFYLEPALSPKQDIISVVSFNPDFEQNILFLEFPSGKVIKSLSNSNCYSYQDLTWLSNNQLLYIVENFLGQTAIYKYNLTTNSEEKLTPYSLDPIKDLTVADNKIFFSYPVNNVYNICSLALKDTLPYQTFYSEVSASQASIKDGRMVFSSNRYWGDQLRTLTLDQDFWTPILWNDYKDLTRECSTILKLDNYTNLPSNNLSPFYNLINFKRIRFSYDQREAFIYTISQNPMRTFTFHAKTLFDFSNQGIKTTVSNVISKHYPNILSEISHSNSNFSADKFEEVTYGSSVKLPYYFGAGSYSGYVNLNAGIYHLDRYKSRKVLNFTKQADFYINYLKSELSFNLSKIKAKNQFYSPFGQNYLFSYKKSIDNKFSQQYYLMADYSFSGLRKSDSILWENSFLAEKNSNKYLFPNLISSVYGYTKYPPSDRIYKSTLKYFLPLFYPEKGIDNVIFLKRIYTSLFASSAKSIINRNNHLAVREHNALGNELIFDYNLMDSIEFKVGLRYSYAFNKSFKHQFDIFIPFSKF